MTRPSDVRSLSGPEYVDYVRDLGERTRKRRRMERLKRARSVLQYGVWVKFVVIA